MCLGEIQAPTASWLYNVSSSSSKVMNKKLGLMYPKFSDKRKIIDMANNYLRSWEMEIVWQK